MHIADIKNDIVNHDIRGIEGAFRALIGWPNEEEIEGATAAQLGTTLEEVCQTLADDDSIMPGGVLDAITEIIGKPIRGTYSVGAEAVLQHIEIFKARFAPASTKHED